MRVSVIYKISTDQIVNYSNLVVIAVLLKREDVQYTNVIFIIFVVTSAGWWLK